MNDKFKKQCGIAEFQISDVNGNNGTLAIFKIFHNTSNPTKLLNETIDKYFNDDEEFIQLIDIYFDNPWMRVIIKGDIDYSNLNFKTIEEIKMEKIL